MKAYLDFTNEIDSYSDVLNTVNAVEQIAASSIHRLKNTVAALDSYTQAIRTSMDRLSGLGVKDTTGYFALPKKGTDVLCVIGGDQGMVGDLYHALVNKALDLAPNYGRIVAVGAKILSYLAEEGVTVERSFPSFSEDLSPQEMLLISEYLFSGFGRDFKSVDVLYPEFISVASQQPRLTHLLPFSAIEPLAAAAPPVASSSAPPIHEPDPVSILNWLLTRYIEVVFLRYAAESKVSELASRTVASEQAAAKTRKLIASTQLAFFRERERWLDQQQLESFSVRSSYDDTAR